MAVDKGNVVAELGDENVGNSKTLISLLALKTDCGLGPIYLRTGFVNVFI